jgi:sulfoxide reductase catalytic subunit YedY
MIVRVVSTMAASRGMAAAKRKQPMPSTTPIASSEITSEAQYLMTRRTALHAAGALVIGAPSAGAHAQPQAAMHAALAATRNPMYAGQAEPLSPWDEVASYVLYHEFGEAAEDAVRKSPAMRTEPWTVAVDGDVRRPKVYGIDELLRLAPMEERVYRHRCVGGWYMVVPWLGYSLVELIRRVEPTGNAKYVEFTSHWDASIMGNAYYQFPYIESLRLDEAQHPLVLLGFGHHGRVLPKQNGAPLRVLTPWKFAHKSPKAIVRIRFTEQQPAAFFHTQYSHLYGWYRNVHPELAQNGSQRREKRVGEWFKRRDTPLLNGYADQVASLYGSSLHSLR